MPRVNSVLKEGMVGIGSARSGSIVLLQIPSDTSNVTLEHVLMSCREAGLFKATFKLRNLIAFLQRSLKHLQLIYNRELF